jgi:hypothetical protein
MAWVLVEYFISAVIDRLDRAIQYSLTGMVERLACPEFGCSTLIEGNGSGILDRPA